MKHPRSVIPVSIHPILGNGFPDKAGLFTALIHQLSQSDPLLTLPDAALIVAPPKLFLRHLAATVMDRFSGNEPFFRLIRLLLAESGRFPELAQAFVQQIQKPVVARLTFYFGHHPELKLSDPEVAARMFMGTLMHYMIIQEILYSGEILPMERDRLIDGLVDVLSRQS
jgi:AcrR family transcriptional regulator